MIDKQFAELAGVLLLQDSEFGSDPSCNVVSSWVMRRSKQQLQRFVAGLWDYVIQLWNLARSISRHSVGPQVQRPCESMVWPAGC